jgi:hypothetical protein
MTKTDLDKEMDPVPDDRNQDHAHPYLLSRESITHDGTNTLDPKTPQNQSCSRSQSQSAHTHNETKMHTTNA